MKWHSPTAIHKLRSRDQMLKWLDVLRLARNGNLGPDQRVVKTDEEWRAQLTPEQYFVTRQHGTERPFSSEICSLFEPGLYACVCCDTLLDRKSTRLNSSHIPLSRI